MIGSIKEIRLAQRLMEVDWSYVLLVNIVKCKIQQGTEWCALKRLLVIPPRAISKNVMAKCKKLRGVVWTSTKQVAESAWALQEVRALASNLN